VDLGTVRPLQFAVWHPDGRRILVLGRDGERPMRLYLVSATGGDARPVTEEGLGFQAGVINKPFSNDGRRFFALDRENRVIVHDLEDGAQRESHTLGDDEEPIRWCADDRAIFVWRRGDVPLHIERLDVATGARTPWREFAPAERTGVVCSRAAFLTPDGEQCAYTYAHLISELFLARGVQ
jgi:hypothetical protein